MNRLMKSLALASLPLAAGCAALQPAPPPELDASIRLAAGLSAYEEGRYQDAFEELAWVVRGCPDQEAGLHARVTLAALELDPRNRAGRPAVGTELLADLILSPRTPDWVRPAAETTYLLGLALGAPPPGGAAPPDTVADPAPDTVARTPVEEPAEEAVAEREAEHPTPEPVEPVAETDQARERGPLVQAGEAPVYGCGRVLEARADTTLALPTLPGPSMMALLVEAESGRVTAEERIELLERELERVRRELAEARVELERIRRTLRP
jgi:hypothetical protein